MTHSWIDLLIQSDKYITDMPEWPTYNNSIKATGNKPLGLFARRVCPRALFLSLCRRKNEMDDAIDTPRNSWRRDIDMLVFARAALLGCFKCVCPHGRFRESREVSRKKRGSGLFSWHLSFELICCLMTRPLRIAFPGAVYHITSRGNERKAIFWDTQDREAFLENLQRVLTRYNWLCHAYCLMDNHALCWAQHKTCYVKFRIMWSWSAIRCEFSHHFVLIC